MKRLAEGSQRDNDPTITCGRHGDAARADLIGSATFAPDKRTDSRRRHRRCVCLGRRRR